MRVYKIIVCTIVGLIFLIFLASCGSVSTVGNPNFRLPTGQKAFYSDAMDTTPVIEATTSAASISAMGVSMKVTSGWTSGNPAYEVFRLLQEYEYPRDEGIIDVSNIYKALWEAGVQYDNALDIVQELPVPTVISPPFDFGNDPVTYTHASDHAALALDGDTIKALLTWIWDESPTMSYGVIEGSFNDTTGDIGLDMVYLVDYEGDSDYCLRTFIAGNKISHSFTLRTVKCGTAEGAYAISMIGAGISQSDNVGDYFLLKAIDNGNLADFPEGRWFRALASANEDDLMAEPDTGSGLADIADPNNYAETINGLTFFALDGSDNATSVDDFLNSSLILDY